MMAEEKEYDLENRQHLFDFLIDANIRLVRYEYLRHLAREKRLWPRRQEAEHETFKDKNGSTKTALVTLEEYKDNIRCIYSVSHCWEAKQHPDPFGFQAGEILRRLGQRFGCLVFIDFICLPQYYRTAEEQVFFKRAMANMHVLYAHQEVFRVIRLEKLADQRAKASPPDFIDIYYEKEGATPGSGKFGPQPFSKLVLNDTPYHERGWCEAEKQWMSTTWYIEGFASMTPARFRERVERGHQNLPDGLVLKFTHRSDEEIVVKLQEKIFLQQAPKRKRLCVVELPESELLLLAESLPHFVNLPWLGFAFLDITEASAVALIAGLKTLRRLTRLDFDDGFRIEEKSARVLAQGLLECQFPGDIEVFVKNESGAQELANELRSLERTGRRVVHESSDVHGTRFTIKAAARVEKGSKVGWLGRQLANFSSCKKRATDPVRVNPDDAHVVAHV